MNDKEIEKETNELNVLRKFVVEFSPIYTTAMAGTMTYAELISAVKEIAELL